MRTNSPNDFSVVCGGGSAGGLYACISFLEKLPPDLGVAVVIVNHSRVVATHLHQILPRYTQMPVELITDGLDIRPNRGFIIPPQRYLHVRDGEFHSEPISKPRGWPDVITVFLRSSTQRWHGRLIPVIVSGYDGDGAETLREIRDARGVVIAQSPDTATQGDRPESAIASGCVDYIFSPEDIGPMIGELTATATVKALSTPVDAIRLAKSQAL